MENIKEFFNINYKNNDGRGYSSGCGYKSGDGYGGGCDSGAGNSDGSGFGHGCGSGEGRSDFFYNEGYGNACGQGSVIGQGDNCTYFPVIKSINGMDMYIVDGFPTMIAHIHGSFAKGYILYNDLSLHPCYIAKGGGYFAHGGTAREACTALEDKIITHMDTKERIKMFLDHFADLGKMYPAREFFEWHSKLTGSCLPGREAFAKAHDIDVDKAEYTVQEFIDLTHDAWGGEVIRELEERLK